MGQLPHGEGGILGVLVCLVCLRWTSYNIEKVGCVSSEDENFRQDVVGEQGTSRATSRTARSTRSCSTRCSLLSNYLLYHDSLSFIMTIVIQIAPTDLGVDKSAMEKRLLGDRAEVFIFKNIF